MAIKEDIYEERLKQLLTEAKYFLKTGSGNLNSLLKEAKILLSDDKFETFREKFPEIDVVVGELISKKQQQDFNPYRK